MDWNSALVVFNSVNEWGIKVIICANCLSGTKANNILDTCWQFLLTKLQCTTLYNKDVKQLQQILILVHFHHLYLDQQLILHFLIMFLFQEIIILLYSLPYFKNNPIINFIYIDMHRSIICYSFMFLDNVLKIIPNIWNRIWSIRQIKFIIPIWSRNFKFIVVICRFNVFSCIINA